MNNYEIPNIEEYLQPYGLDDKIFQPTDDEGNVIGEPYSYNDHIKRMNLLGPK
jgi:hypothetical protein